MMKKLSLALLTILAVLTFFAGTTIVSVLNGGTGLSNPTAHAVLVGEGSSPMAVVGPGSTGQCLEGQGGSSDPAFLTCPISGGTSGGGFAWGGSGVDGTITADGSSSPACLGSPGTYNGIASAYQLAHDCNATAFTVNSGITVFSNGMRIFATQSITVNGTIRDNGTNGGAGSGAVSGSTGSGEQSSGTTFATGCIWRASSTCQIANNSSTGGAGASGNGSAGNNATNGTDNTFIICPSASVAGATGGHGGNGGTGTGAAGGVAGTAVSCSPQSPAFAAYSLPVALTWTTNFYNNTPTLAQISYLPSNGGSSGGGGGGGDGSNGGGNGGGAGGPGGYGGLMVLASPTITVNSGASITANGGNGGTGAVGASPGAGNAGGGGGGAGGDGGNGGVIVLVYHSYTNSGTVSVSAGSGASGGGGGTAHGTGANGTAGGNGSNGLAGLILQIPQ